MLRSKRKAPELFLAEGSGAYVNHLSEVNGMDATTCTNENQLAADPSRRSFVQTALAVLTIPAAAHASPSQISESDLRREQVLSLCQEVEFMRAWFAQYQDQIREMNHRAAYELNDVVIGAACTARTIARAAGTTLDRYATHPWGIDSRTVAVA